MVNFIFDLQRFASFTISSWTVPAADGIYKVNSSSISATASATVAPATAGEYYVKVDSTSTPGTVALSLADSTGTDVTDGSTITFTTLNFNGTSTNTTLSVDATTIPTVTTTVLKSAAGAQISDGTKTFTAAPKQTATITKTGANYELTAGSVVLSTTAGESDPVIVKGQTVTGTAATKVTVNSSGTVTGLSATAGFSSKFGTTGSTYTYTVSADGLSIVATDSAGSDAAGTYYVKQDIKSTTVTLTGDNNIDKLSAVKSFTNGTAGIDFTINFDGSGIAVDTTAIASKEGDINVFKNGNKIVYAAYTASSLGSAIGKMTYNSSTDSFTYDASKSGVGQILSAADTKTAGAAAVVSLVTKVIGSNANDSIDYSAQTTNAYTIDGGAGADQITLSGAVGLDKSSVVGGAGNDTIDIATGVVANNIYIGGGDGNDSIGTALTTATGTGWTIAAGAGNDEINLSTIANAAGAIDWVIDGGDGNNKVNTGVLGHATVKTGSGNDTIVSGDATNTIVTGDGNDVIDVSTAGYAANVTDYAYGKDVFYVGTTGAEADAIALAATKANLATNGAMTITGKGVATVSATGAFYAATLTDDTKEKVDIGWVKDEATTIDASKSANKVVLTGQINAEGDMLIGGAKADTIYAGANDSVFGGAGNDIINIESTSTTGVYVGVSNDSGADTVNNFKAGFDIDTSDAVSVIGGSIDSISFAYDGTNTTVKSGKGTLDLQGVVADPATNAVGLLVNGKKVYSIAEGANVSISSSDQIADFFYGTKASGIDLTSYDDSISVDLSNSMFKNINSVVGGKGSTSILGGKAAETLTGGAGSTSLFGGAGKDVLISGAGKTDFVLAQGAGKDTVQGFVTGTGDASDVVNVFGSGISGITRASDGDSVFTVKVSDNDSLLINTNNSGVNEKIQWQSGDAKGVAKIGYNSKENGFTFDSEVTNYLGGSKNDTVSVSSGTTEDFTVWLDQTGGLFTDIDTYDMSGTTGEVLLAGKHDASETLIAGQGDSSLWGGAGNAKDVLVGNSSGTTQFFYGLGDGDDLIQGNAADTMNLYNISLSDVTKATINDNNVVFTTSSNNTVTVSGSVGTFKLADGSSWKADYSNKTWTPNN